MTRPDLEALVRDYYGHPLAAPYAPFGAVDLAHTVAAHERARIVAKLREKARSRESAMNDLVLWQFADELEADHG